MCLQSIVQEIRRNFHGLSAAETEVASSASLGNCLSSHKLDAHRATHGIVEPAEVGSQFRSTLLAQVFDNAAFGIVDTKLEGSSISFNNLEHPIIGVPALLADGSVPLALVDSFLAEQTTALPAEQQAEWEAAVELRCSQIDQASGFLH